MINPTEKYILQFPVNGGSCMNDNGFAYFESRARKAAAQKSCVLVGMNNVRLEFVRGRWSVSGTAILEKLQATG